MVSGKDSGLRGIEVEVEDVDLNIKPKSVSTDEERSNQPTQTPTPSLKKERPKRTIVKPLRYRDYEEDLFAVAL